MNKKKKKMYYRRDTTDTGNVVPRSSNFIHLKTRVMVFIKKKSKIDEKFIFSLPSPIIFIVYFSQIQNISIFKTCAICVQFPIDWLIGLYLRERFELILPRKAIHIFSIHSKPKTCIFFTQDHKITSKKTITVFARNWENLRISNRY